MASKIGVLGSGIVGRTLAEGFLKHGYDAMLGSRDPLKEEITSWQSNHPAAKTGTFRDATIFGDIIVLAVLGRAVDDVLALSGPDHFVGKTVIDTTNPIADAPPVGGVIQFTTGPNESLGENIQKQLANARLVKAFNSVGSAYMINPKFEQGTPTMFFCGNNPDAKQQVSEIIAKFGWEPYDCGGITASRALEPLCMLWCIPGFAKNQWHHAFKLLTK